MVGMLVNLSKVFDCITHNLLIAKLSAYGLQFNGLKYIYTYLKNRKQCGPVNNVCSDFKDIISGVPQVSIVGPMLFNVFLNDFFFCTRKASLHNFGDHNTLSSTLDETNSPCHGEWTYPLGSFTQVCQRGELN